jgi:phospholipid/cholesterol/gamma-HCH transport system ATP-binding protein
VSEPAIKLLTEPAIKIVGLAVGWGGRPLLKHLDFEIARGDIFAILGPSGCGKTTLLRNLIGLETPISGRIEICCEPSLQLDPAIPPPRPPWFGVLFQSGALLASLTLAENLSLPLRRWTWLDPEAIAAVVRSKLGLVGLGGTGALYPSELSGGMRKRAGIARALTLDPQLLFLDEPSAGLDPRTAAGLDDLILALNASLGTTVVLVTHELGSIFKIARSCIMLDRDAGGIIARGDPRKLKDETSDARVHGFFNRIAPSRRSGHAA